MKNSPDRASVPARRTAASRRRFLKLFAAGSAAALAGAVPAAGATRARRKRSPTSPDGGSSAAVRKEIENQKQYVARSLDALRRHPLSPGSEPAYVFVPIEAREPGKDTGNRKR
jgi:hypothetical protein